MTSSARASTVAGTSRPIALAVLRLITSSYLVGACTGRSAGFSPLNAIDIAGGAAELVHIIRTVGNEAAGGDHVTKWIDRRQFVPSRERNDQVTSNHRISTSRHDQAAIRRAGEGRHGALDNANVLHADRGNLYSERRRYSLNGAELGGSDGNGGIVDDSRPRHLWRDLLEQFQPFAAETVFERHEAGHVAARPRQAIGEARADRIGDGRKH